MNSELIFEILQVAIGNRKALSSTLSAAEWEDVYDMCKKQAVVGIAFAALERLSKEQLPPGRRIRQWAVKADKIREHNARLTKESAQICRYFEQNGFEAVILKGQANYAYYPEWLQGLRSAGDIDVWCWPKANTNETQSEIATKTKRPSDYENENEDKVQGTKYKVQECKNLLNQRSVLNSLNHPVRAVIEFCLSKKKGRYLYYHNMDFPILPETPVEVHYRPTWLYNPFANRRLQRWFEEIRDIRVFKDLKVASVEFDVVFQLLHLYKHIFEEGIGLRQLLDYYFVITKYGDFVRKRNATLRNAIGDCYENETLRYETQSEIATKTKRPLDYENETQSEIATKTKRPSDYENENEDKVQGTKYKVQECKNLLNQRAEASDLNSLNSEASAEVLNQRAEANDLNLLNQRSALNPSTIELITKLGLKEFAGAVMYVMQEVLLMPREMMLCEPREREGRRLLDEIMQGGNFGKYDERYNWEETTNGSMEYRGADYAMTRLRHNAKFLRDYPSEVLWEPVFRVYHWFWRRLRLWRYE